MTETQRDPLSAGMTLAVALHVVVAVGVVSASYINFHHRSDIGESTQAVGAIEASMVSALPLPAKAEPVEKNVLASEDVTPTPAPPPKEKAAEPPPKPTDVLLKGKTTPAPKTAPVATPAPPKHPQPTPDTTKAASGDPATQLPQSTTQLKNGTASFTVQSRTIGSRYAYYAQIISRVVSQNFAQEFIDPRSSQGRTVSITFDVQTDGTVTNIRTESASGSSSLDSSAKRAVQQVDSFGPNPSGTVFTVEFKFHGQQ